ncbi:unnamed protein product [Moneuplotes crassus]|uniref:Uncharacterized protein n=1 Tax=Euplotes crassus TaxID=5936 RepID=A0AAD1X8M2_EUPCR|nr:unnamed protein product [Moneuplotes crassus]
MKIDFRKSLKINFMKVVLSMFLQAKTRIQYLNIIKNPKPPKKKNRMLHRHIPPSSPPITKNTLIIPQKPRKTPDLPPKIVQSPYSNFPDPSPAPPPRFTQRTLNQSLTKIPEISQESPNSSATSSVASSQRINADELQKFMYHDQSLITENEEEKGNKLADKVKDSVKYYKKKSLQNIKDKLNKSQTFRIQTPKGDDEELIGGFKEYLDPGPKNSTQEYQLDLQSYDSNSNEEFNEDSLDLIEMSQDSEAYREKDDVSNIKRERGSSRKGGFFNILNSSIKKTMQILSSPFQPKYRQSRQSRNHNLRDHFKKYKYLTKVGKIKNTNKKVPRWASNHSFLSKFSKHIKKVHQAEEILGAMNLKKESSLKMVDIFDLDNQLPNNCHKSPLFTSNKKKAMREIDQRGSSANWDDKDGTTARKFCNPKQFLKHKKNDSTRKMLKYPNMDS